MGTKGNRLGLSLLCVLLAACLLAGCGEKQESSWQDQYDLGVRYLDEGSYEEAILAFTAAIELDPKRPEAYVGRGQAYVASGETEDNLAAAQADYEAALELDDTLAEAWLGLADVYVIRGDPEKAQELLEEARDKTGDNQDVLDRLEELLKELEPEEPAPQPDESQPDGSQPENQPDSQPGGTEAQGQKVDARAQFDQFLADKGYASYLGEWSYGQPQEYALLDVDGDGYEELIISGRGELIEFAGLAIFRLDAQSGRILPVQIYTPNMEGGTVGQFFNTLEYSRQYRALVFSELRTAYMYGDYGFYVLEGDRLSAAFSIGYEVTTDGTSEVTSYSIYRDGASEPLTQEEYEAYHGGTEVVQFQPLPA